MVARGFACVGRVCGVKRIERVVVGLDNKTGQSRWFLSLSAPLAVLLFPSVRHGSVAVCARAGRLRWVGLAGKAGFRRPRGFFFLVFRSSLVNLCTGDQLHGKRGRPFSRSSGLLSGDGRATGARQPARRAKEAAIEETNATRAQQGPRLQLARVVAPACNQQIR